MGNLKMIVALVLSFVAQGLSLKVPATINPALNQRVAAGALAALLTVAPIQDAFAASRAGGRVGGRVSSTRVAPAPRAPAPSASSTMAPRTTNIYVAPPPVVTSPFGGGYGYLRVWLQSWIYWVV